MKVHAYETSAPDSAYVTAYLDDEPLVGGVHFGNLKHGACEALTAKFEVDRDRWEIVWRQPFKMENYL